MVQRTQRDDEGGDQGALGAGLEGLADQADQLGQVNQDGSPGTNLVTAEPTKPTNAQLLAGALATGREVFCNFTKFESPKRTLSDEKVKELADAWAPILEKHGIDLSVYLGEWGAEIAAVIVTVQIGWDVRIAFLGEIAERERAAKQRAEGNGEPG